MMPVFQSPYACHKKRNGQVVMVLGRVDPSTYNYLECGEMWHVKFGDGTTVEAWPEELWERSKLLGWSVPWRWSSTQYRHLRTTNSGADRERTSDATV